MNEEPEARVDVEEPSENAREEKGERVRVNPGGIHICDGDSEVHVTWGGVRIHDGETNLSVNLWQPLLGCAAAGLVFVGLATALVVWIIKLILR